MVGVEGVRGIKQQLKVYSEGEYIIISRNLEAMVDKPIGCLMTLR
jgi:hypothetical protein